MAPNQQPGILIQMMEARQACRDLMGLMVEENESLMKHQTDKSEARLQLKKRLALRLEKLLADIKAQKDDWRGDAQAQNIAMRLAEEIEHFRELAAHNEMMLRAAHQIRADMVAVIRDTIDAAQPKVTTYNNKGGVKDQNNGTTVVGTTI